MHEGKWTIKLKPDRSLKIWKPNGMHWYTTDPPTRKIKQANNKNQANKWDNTRSKKLDNGDMIKNESEKQINNEFEFEDLQTEVPTLINQVELKPELKNVATFG